MPVLHIYAVLTFRLRRMGVRADIVHSPNCIMRLYCSLLAVMIVQPSTGRVRRWGTPRWLHTLSAKF